MLPLPIVLRETLLAGADLLWPRRCLHCDEPAASPLCLCDACRAAFTTDPHNTCPRCSSTVGPHADATEGCLRCKSQRFHFGSAQRLGVYDGPLRDAILTMKRRGGETLAEVMGLVWAEACREKLLKSNPQAVVAVPLHWRRRFARGFNQAELIARGVAEGLRLPFIPLAIRRVKATPQQTGVSPTERRENLKGTFRPVRRGLKGLRVLLIDDVLTTGATADAAAVAILAGGAAQVDVAVLAHR